MEFGGRDGIFVRMLMDVRMAMRLTVMSMRMRMHDQIFRQILRQRCESISVCRGTG